MTTRSTETDEQAYARAMRDPEVQEIMSDPVMQTILQQAQQQPESLMQHLRNPGVKEKIDKLVRAVSRFAFWTWVVIHLDRKTDLLDIALALYDTQGIIRTGPGPR